MATHTHIIKQEEAQTENSVQIRVADPGSPVASQLWVNTSSGDLKVYTGGATVVVGAATLAAALSTHLGAGRIVETSFTVVNNQSSAADVTGLLFNGGSVRSFVVEYHIYRNTTSSGATELAEAGILIGAYSTVAASWEMQQAPVVGDSGVTLTITTAGQVQYASTDITGTPASSTMKFKARTMGV